MSTFVINAKDQSHDIFVGWDPMMSTYFAHVIDTTCDEGDEDRDVLWIGCGPNEIHDEYQIVVALRPYMDYDEDELARILYRDSNW